MATMKKKRGTGFYKKIKQLTHAKPGSQGLEERGNDENSHRLVSCAPSGL